MTTPENENPQDQNPYGQNPYGQNPQGQQPYGAPSYGQTPYGQPAYGQPGPGFSGAPLTPQETSSASMSHWLALVVGFVSCGLLGWLVPLVIRGGAGQQSAFVRAHATESLNAQLTYLIAAVISGVLSFVGIGLLTGAVAFIAIVVFAIIATTKASAGEPYRYPVSIRMAS